MPDLPSPQDAAEAALLDECWDTVLSYADLCTTGSRAAVRLAAEAFAHGMREVRAADATAARGTVRRLPRIPLLLTAVRTTAAAWEDDGRGHELDSGLRLWLGSAQAARYAGPPPRRPLALRGLKDMQPPDAELLWLADVEALPLSVVARRLGLDPATASDELAQVRDLFRDRCRRGHLDAPLDARCRGYARLLDAVTRSSAADVPDDLSRHLATCPDCAEAAACLRTNGGGPPAALAAGVIGWGGLAYLERRRRAADVRLGAGRPATADDDRADAPPDGGHRARVVRGGLLATAVLVSLVALTVSLMPFGDTAEDGAASAGTVDRRPVAVPDPVLPPAGPRPSHTSPPTAGTTAAAPARTPRTDPDPEPQGTATPTPSTEDPPERGRDGPPAPEPSATGPAACRVRYDLVNQWPDGFQATVTVTSADALDSWRVAWTFPDGQRIGQMWDASHAQSGPRVTATAAEYNGSVPAGGRLAFGFLASWRGKNSPPYDFTLNGRACERA
ncbi:cellulose-binding domain-containing protein [Streptomyces pactum]|uniref:Cellulose-binding protein n=1 Tax=Streptomyces pactum TaxID=68249 RepID=A0A1S6J4X1_9ACTN|nr:cellulose-binding domain-containing protein [Streptomyces pactum]AQS66819.1 cellulose-binding protein [Streptomyces pactum]